MQQSVLEQAETEVKMSKYCHQYMKRKRFIELNKSKCAKCKKEGDTLTLEIDHIVPRKSGGINDVSNLQVLCIECHIEKTKNENKNRRFLKSGIIRHIVCQSCSYSWGYSGIFIYATCPSCQNKARVRDEI